MALPASGQLSIADINTELNVAVNTQRSFNETAMLTLAGLPLGKLSISDFWGKANGPKTVSITLSAHTLQKTITSADIPGYSASGNNIEIIIPAGIYIWSDSTAVAALTISLGASDVVTITNYGYIMGKGGDGGSSWNAMTAGGPAINTNVPLIINNVSGYIAGGGGGGAGGTMSTGGGGAGGGRGGGAYSATLTPGGSIGQVGGNGYVSSDMASGGGGGRILPGTGGPAVGSNSYTAIPGQGGGSGGGGGFAFNYSPYGGGGGGGWGAQGGWSAIGATDAYGQSGKGGDANSPGGNGTGTIEAYGALGGNAIVANGKLITISSGATRIYGAIG